MTSRAGTWFPMEFADGRLAGWVTATKSYRGLCHRGGVQIRGRSRWLSRGTDHLLRLRITFSLSATAHHHPRGGPYGASCAAGTSHALCAEPVPRHRYATGPTPPP